MLITKKTLTELVLTEVLVHKNFIMLKYLVLPLIFLMSSCGSDEKKKNIDENYLILKKIIDNENVGILNISRFSNNTPKKYLKRYLNSLKLIGKDKKHDSLMSVLNGKVEWIFSENDIVYMTNKYKTWNKKKWHPNLLSKRINFYGSKKLPDKVSIPVYIVSQPMYSKNGDKSFVVVLEYRSRRLENFLRIILLKKEKLEWNIVGRLWSGHH